VKDQNWFAVALDFFIVVAGILIAFQITNWNEGRSERALTNDYLHRLHTDLSLSLTSTQSTRNFIHVNAERLERSTAFLKSCDLPEDARDDFTNSIFHIGKLVPAQFVSDTFDELKASGRFGLLRNVELRDRLSEAAREIKYQQNVWSALHGRAKPPQSYVDQRIVLTFDAPPGGFGTATWDNMDTDFADLCDDARLLASFSILIRLGHTNIDWLDRNIENFQEAKDAVEQELGITLKTSENK
jgi:hypothetical protein